jgi:hypothetical protein
VRDALGLTDAEAGRVFGVSWRTVFRWRQQQWTRRPQPRHWAAIDQVLQLEAELGERLRRTPLAVHRWLQMPNPKLEGRSPLTALLAGEVTRVTTLAHETPRMIVSDPPHLQRRRREMRRRTAAEHGDAPIEP